MRTITLYGDEILFASGGVRIAISGWLRRTLGKGEGVARIRSLITLGTQSLTGSEGG